MKGIEYAKKGILLSMTLGMAYGCAEPVDEGGVRGVTDDEIVIGGWGPQTGPAALWGSVGRGAAAYFDMINEEVTCLVNHIILHFGL